MDEFDDESAQGRDHGESDDLCSCESGEVSDTRRTGRVDRLTSRLGARAALRDALAPKLVIPQAPRSRRGPTYGPRIIAALITCWAVLRALAGKRLAPMLPVLMPILRRDGELALTDDETDLLYADTSPESRRFLAILAISAVFINSVALTDRTHPSNAAQRGPS